METHDKNNVCFLLYPKWAFATLRLQMEGPNYAQDNAETSSSKKKRTMFNDEQKSHLEQQFMSNPYPDKSQRKRLAEDLGVKDKSIDYWFGHRRAKQAKCKRMGSVQPEGSISTAPQVSFTSSKIVEQKAETVGVQDTFGASPFFLFHAFSSS